MRDRRRTRRACDPARRSIEVDAVSGLQMRIIVHHIVFIALIAYSRPMLNPELTVEVTLLSSSVC
jgi:hypothetical protein